MATFFLPPLGKKALAALCKLNYVKIKSVLKTRTTKQLPDYNAATVLCHHSISN